MMTTEQLTSFCRGDAKRVLEAFYADFIPYEGHRMIVYGETTDGLLFLSEFIEEDPGFIVPMETFDDEYEARFTASILADQLISACYKETVETYL